MTRHWLTLTCAAGLLAGGCAHPKTSTPLSVCTDQHSPFRMHIYENPAPENLNAVLLLPSLGIEDSGLREQFNEQLYRAVQRRFSIPVKTISANSAYEPYISPHNLLCSDGTLNIKEISIIGTLMNTGYVLCPHVRNIRPYHPQCIDLVLAVVNARSGKICAEFTAVFDLRDRDVSDYFIEFCKANKASPEDPEDLDFRSRSPATFQAFVADMSSSVLAEQLTF